MLLLTYYHNPQNTADDKHKISETIQFWQCFLQEREYDRDKES